MPFPNTTENNNKDFSVLKVLKGLRREEILTSAGGIDDQKDSDVQRSQHLTERSVDRMKERSVLSFPLSSVKCDLSKDHPKWALWTEAMRKSGARCPFFWSCETTSLPHGHPPPLRRSSSKTLVKTVFCRSLNIAQIQCFNILGGTQKKAELHDKTIWRNQTYPYRR